MRKLKNRTKYWIYLTIIILVVIISLLLYRSFIVKPCSRILPTHELHDNISEYPFYELDLSN